MGSTRYSHCKNALVARSSIRRSCNIFRRKAHVRRLTHRHVEWKWNERSLRGQWSGNPCTSRSKWHWNNVNKYLFFFLKKKKKKKKKNYKRGKFCLSFFILDSNFRHQGD